MNRNELGTRLWGIPKGKYLTGLPSPQCSLDWDSQAHYYTRPAYFGMKVASEKRQNFTEVILNVKKGDIQSVNTFDTFKV